MLKDNLDIRWQQRLDNYKRALSQLGNAIELMQQRKLSRLEEQGTIQAFEYTHELAWKLLKDYLEEQGGYSDLVGSKDSTRMAFKTGLIEHGEVWMDMIASRNLSSHTYNEELAQSLIEKIREYYTLLLQLRDKMSYYAAQ